MTPIVSKKVLVQFVNIQEDDDRFDKVLEMLAGVVSGMVQDFLGRKLEAVTRVEYARSYSSDSSTNPGDDQLILLNSYPIGSTPALVLKYSDSLSWDTSAPLVEGVDYMVDSEAGLIRVFPASGKGFSSRVFKNHPMGFQVTHKSGYDLVTAKWPYLNVPQDMMTAAALQTAFYFHAHTHGSLGFDNAGGDSKESSSKSKLDDPQRTNLLPEVRAMLTQFKKTPGMIGVRK